jgi:hypothetical protein
MFMQRPKNMQKHQSLDPSCDAPYIETLNQNHLKLKVERGPPLCGLPSAN